MIIVQSTHPRWLSNTWLVGDPQTGEALLIDSGGPSAPIIDCIEREGFQLRYLLCSHHHMDHIFENELYRERFGTKILAHESEAMLIKNVDRCLADGDELSCGGLQVRALHIPGHTIGQLAFLIEGVGVFTGDTLFKGSIGGTRAPGHTNYEDIRHSIMERLMTLPPELEVFPGHQGKTSIGAEWESNPFIRIWRGLDPVGSEAVEAMGEPALLRLLAKDYDGGTKAWVTFLAGMKDDIVPGSRIARS